MSMEFTCTAGSGSGSGAGRFATLAIATVADAGTSGSPKGLEGIKNRRKCTHRKKARKDSRILRPPSVCDWGKLHVPLFVGSIDDVVALYRREKVVDQKNVWR